MIFLDTNILVDVLDTPSIGDGTWSRKALERVSRVHALVTNLIVVAELSAHLASPGRIEAALTDAEIEVVALSFGAAARAGAAFREYRLRGGPRLTILPDFLIAGHAVVIDAALMTRDRRLASYFPDLILLTPDTDHG